MTSPINALYVGQIRSEGQAAIKRPIESVAPKRERAPIAVPPYAIVPSAAVGSGLGNYTIMYANGKLAV